MSTMLRSRVKKLVRVLCDRVHSPSYHPPKGRSSSRPWSRLLASGFALSVTLSGARAASAYTIESQITTGCHESISAQALREVRADGGLAPPLPYTAADDAPLADDVPFHLPDDMRDMGGLTLLLGVRDNDVKSLAPTALDELAQITADPTTQREHCLRTLGETEPNGTSMAVADCRAYIKERLLAALDGLGPDGRPDGSLRDPLTVSLPLRDKYTVSLPRFYLDAGQAIHAIQDSFAHTFRNADQHQITVTLDWIHYADNTLDEAADGPAHLSQLDRCDDPDPLRTQRHALAIEASAAFLRTALDTTLSRDAKSAAFDQLLDTYVVFDAAAGCTFANHWCNAPENQYRTSSCACGVAGASKQGRWSLALVVLAASLARRRRRRSVAWSSTPIGLHGVGALVVAAGILLPRAASAQEPPTVPAAPEHAAQGPIAALQGVSQAAKPGTRDPAGSFFGHLAVGASYDHAALAFALHGKYQISQGWMVGVDVEWNPWIPTEPLSFRAGAGNVYGSLVRRYQMAFEAVNLRTTAAVGVSTLLINLPGADKWSFGPLLGISFLGLEWKMAPGFFLVVNPTYIFFAVPHVTGVPLDYYQYRFQVGLEFGG